MAIYGAVLFFLLSPGVLFRFPAKNHLLVLCIHAVLFAIIYQLTYKAVYKQIYGREEFAETGDSNLVITICIIAGFIVCLGLILWGAKTWVDKKTKTISSVIVI